MPVQKRGGRDSVFWWIACVRRCFAFVMPLLLTECALSIEADWEETNSTVTHVSHEIWESDKGRKKEGKTISSWEKLYRKDATVESCYCVASHVDRSATCSIFVIISSLNFHRWISKDIVELIELVGNGSFWAGWINSNRKSGSTALPCSPTRLHMSVIEIPSWFPPSYA